VGILQLPALSAFLSGEYTATEFSPLSTQLQRHLFSASLAKLTLTADSQLNSLDSLNLLLYTSSERTTSKTHAPLLLLACSFPREHVYRAVA
jgi:hypothetical protein